ncbi:MAG TPA: hypothetical protein VMJ66_08385 [Geobacteraceae bacterium]|nr:hypothetical protein [Geobacteraceae bacterium]
MARISALLLAIIVLSGAVPVMAADGDIRTCSLTKGLECVSDEGCVEWTMEEMSLPRFVRIDLASRTITSLDKEVKRTSKIASVERLNGLIILHGTEQRGWSMALAEDSGNLTISASGDDEGFIVFGSCIMP